MIYLAQPAFKHWTRFIIERLWPGQGESRDRQILSIKSRDLIKPFARALNHVTWSHDSFIALFDTASTTALPATPDSACGVNPAL